MVIYHAVTYYHMLKCGIHKLKFHPKEFAVLLVPAALVNRCSGLFPTVGEEAVFEKVFFQEWYRSPAGGEESLKVKEIDKQMEEWLGADFMERVSEINICSAAYYFGIWAMAKKYPFNWFEEADGMLSKAYFLEQADGQANPVRYQMAQKYGCYYGDGVYVLKKYVTLEAQLPGFRDDLAVDFNVIREMQGLSKNQKNMLLNFFDVPLNLQLPRNSAIMLTQHFANMKMLSYEEQALIYQITCDYYLTPYQIYFKWHPTDIVDYPSFVENVTMISGLFPSELLTLVVEEPIAVCASIESSGTKNLATMCDRILLFERSYITTTFRQNHRYYFCLKLLEAMTWLPVCAVGLSQSHMENLVEFGGVSVQNERVYLHALSDTQQVTGAHIYLIGNPSDITEFTMDSFFLSRNKEDVIVFLNCEEENHFWQFRNHIPFVVKDIRIKALDSQEYGGEISCEQVFVFTENKEAMESVRKMKYIKKLLQTGVETAVFESTDKDVQIAALRGMLKATEIQLQRYMQENRQLKELMINKN